MTLANYFAYWDNFIQIWKAANTAASFEQRQKKLILSFFPKASNELVEQLVFKYPGKISNEPSGKNNSFEYLPEPYWGFTPKSQKPLEYVVVNYNPASGGSCQERSHNNIKKINSYESYVGEQLELYSKLLLAGDIRKNNSPKPSQFATTNWHNSRRAHKLSDLRLESPTQYYSCKTEPAVFNYLGIDLAPWHSKGISDLNGYIEDNAQAVIHFSLYFAIEAARTIQNPLFRNKIIMRTNLTNFVKYFPNTSGFKYQIKNSIKHGETYTMQNISLVHYPGIKIILVWGKTCQNNLPNHEFMRKVLKK